MVSCREYHQAEALDVTGLHWVIAHSLQPSSAGDPTDYTPNIGGLRDKSREHLHVRTFAHSGAVVNDKGGDIFIIRHGCFG
jgi:hypothetical protein